MKHVTIRNIPPALAVALEREKERRRTSLNQTVISLLSHSLATGGESRRSNGLGRMAGTWSEEERRNFEAAVAVTEQIDEELWR